MAQTTPSNSQNPKTNSESAEDFSDKILKTVINGFTSIGIATGIKLGMFEALAKYTDPKTSQEIAADKGYKERYVREWLGIMVTSSIIDIDEDRKYFLPRHRIPALTDASGMSFYSQIISCLCGVEEDVCACFKLSGPQGIPYSRYPGLEELRRNATTTVFQWPKLKEKISLVPGIINKLEAGAEVVDMGTGTGVIPISIAAQFPQSTVWGLDISKEGISRAKKDAETQGLKNTKFAVQDICNMPTEWTNKWDLVIMFEVAHDVPHTTKLLKEVVRVLKPGGYFLMDDVGIHTEQKDNIAHPIAPFYYTVSLFHCMAVSLNEEGGEGWGAAWGKEKAVELIKASGFAEVTLPTEGLVAVCRKAAN